jgi:hypothetical protein
MPCLHCPQTACGLTPGFRPSRASIPVKTRTLTARIVYSGELSSAKKGRPTRRNFSIGEFKGQVNSQLDQKRGSPILVFTACTRNLLVRGR